MLITVHCIAFHVQFHGLLFLGRAADGNGEARVQIVVADFTDGPGEAAPDGFVIFAVADHGKLLRAEGHLVAGQTELETGIAKLLATRSQGRLQVMPSNWSKIALASRNPESYVARSF